MKLEWEYKRRCELQPTSIDTAATVTYLTSLATIPVDYPIIAQPQSWTWRKRGRCCEGSEVGIDRL